MQCFTHTVPLVEGLLLSCHSPNDGELHLIEFNGVILFEQFSFSLMGKNIKLCYYTTRLCYCLGLDVSKRIFFYFFFVI